MNITKHYDAEGCRYYTVDVVTGELRSTGSTRTFWGAKRLIRRFEKLHIKGIEVDL